MPRPVQGFRIVKPRTENQLLAADAWGRCRPDNVTAILPRDVGLPTDSWWTAARTWETFSQLARREQKRMELSRFGRTVGDNVL